MEWWKQLILFNHTQLLYIRNAYFSRTHCHLGVYICSVCVCEVRATRLECLMYLYSYQKRYSLQKKVKQYNKK